MFLVKAQLNTIYLKKLNLQPDGKAIYTLSKMNSKAEESTTYSAFIQCFELKQNPIFSYFAPPGITCIKYDNEYIAILNSKTVLENVKKYSENFGTNYTQYPLLEINSKNNPIPMKLKDSIAMKLNVPLDTQIHINSFM
jgi:hypothetical protein